MSKIEKVRCPNCGNYAERHHLFKPQNKHQIIQTQCSSCDYLMVNCARTGSVVEAYAPGITMNCHSR